MEANYGGLTRKFRTPDILIADLNGSDALSAILEMGYGSLATVTAV
jgi:hypothetical protein